MMLENRIQNIGSDIKWQILSKLTGDNEEDVDEEDDAEID